ncbi:MAG TPA: hypothetical protein VKU19_19925 [Bryobacteraceae bacterium]|nr:hypothetical protein [Bryobacteraceae bacterium]
MNRLQQIALRSALPLVLVMAAMPATMRAGDLSTYRTFRLGMDLATVAKQTGTNPSLVKVIHSRPALIQELEWHPQPLGASAQTDPAKNVVFSFYNGELYRIGVDYDRYETEGLTVDDYVDAISTAYGPATRPPAPAKRSAGGYGDPDETVAQWQDSEHRFDLIRDSYGPTFKLVGVTKTLEESAKAANLEAKRLDDQEAPQRDAARLASDEATAKAKLDKARLLNKPKFRP